MYNKIKYLIWVFNQLKTFVYNYAISNLTCLIDVTEQSCSGIVFHTYLRIRTFFMSPYYIYNLSYADYFYYQWRWWDHLAAEQRQTFSKILVAIHELRTTTSNPVVDYAIKVAQDYDAQLVILHVIRANVNNLHSMNLPGHVIEMKKQAQAYFIKITEKLHDNENRNKENILRIKTEIIASLRIADALVSYAKDKRIDLIIIGTRGRSKLKGMLLGSVASDVVRYAHCPVLVVK
jgi:nucleotide-binding universal stress UspA family protein